MSLAGRRGSKELPKQQQRRSEADDDERDEELVRQQRIHIDNNAGYLRSSRARSTELHGVVYISEPEADPEHTTQLNHTMQQSGTPQQQHMSDPQSPSGSLGDSADGGVVLQDLEGGKTAQHTAAAPADSDSKVRELLEPIGGPGQEKLVLSFERLSVWAPVMPKKPSIFSRAWKKTVTCGKSESNPQRQILFDVTGQVRPGEVLALMGPSGSGKTSLLTVLGGRSAMKYKGTVSVNGQPYSKATRKRIGFVLQDDVLYESLTVKETLTYAALLRLPRAMTHAQKAERVDTVLEALGLVKSKDTIIGGFFRRGISGGERKRVSIGHELLINPAIIMLDEPTSGLDSTTAMHLISLLQDLAAGGRSVATTIHQPSSRLYQKLDWLMLLAEGHLMYYGKADQVLDWFGGFGYKIPFGVSIADYILDISLGEAGYSSSGASGQAAIKELYTAYETQFGGAASAGNLAMQAGGFSNSNTGSSKKQLQLQGAQGSGVTSSAAADSSGYLAAGGRDQQQHVRVLPLSSVPGRVGDGFTGSVAHVAQGQVSSGVLKQQQPAAMAVTGSSSGAAAQQQQRKQGKDRAPYLEQLRVLLQRTARVRRFEQMTGQHFFQLFAVAFITGLVWWQRGQDYYGGVQAASDILGLLFFILLFPSMRALFRALFTFPNEYRMLLKERPSGMYNLSAYYIARTFADIPAELINTLLFVVIAYWFGGLKHDAGSFFGLLFSLVLVVLTAESWGLLIGGVFMDAKTAQTVTTVVILTFLLVGGYYVRNIPVWISWIRYLSFLYWGYNLLIKTQFIGTTFYNCVGGNCTPVPIDQLSLSVHPSDPAYPDVLILLGMLIFLRLVIYFVLRQKTKVSQKKMK